MLRWLPPIAFAAGRASPRNAGRSVSCTQAAGQNGQARAGGAANVAVSVRLLRALSEVVGKGDSRFEIHAGTDEQLGFARAYAVGHPEIIKFGF